VTLPDDNFDAELKHHQEILGQSNSFCHTNKVDKEILQQKNATEEETALSPPQVTIRKRLPWLLGNIILYITAANAISPFQSFIANVPVLAIIMPVISNTSGNVAIQAVSVTLRGLGVGEVTPLDTFKVLHKEIIAAFSTALALGITLGVLSLIWSPSGERWISVISGVVMMMNVFIAASLGTLLPMILKRLNLDPALISGPLLTTVLDAISFFTFLSMIAIASNFNSHRI
jgi:magnesium transporter